MLFALPAAASEENWVWECVDAALSATFDVIEAGGQATPWLELIPQHRRASLDREKLTASVVEVASVYQALSVAERQVVRQAYEEQRNLAGLFDGGGVATIKAALPEAMRVPLTSLAEAGWDTLKPLGIRKRSYQAFYASLPDRVCAFCGLETFQTVELNRETLDHYLPRSLYPFVTADMRNLVWMSRTCNSGYKATKDTLRTDNGARRACFAPYSAPGVSVSLLRSTLFGRDALPSWIVDLEGDPDRCASWDTLFSVKERWKDHLDRQHEKCLRDVGVLMRRGGAGAQLEQVQEIVATSIELAKNGGLHALFLLQRAIFELWSERLAVAGEERDRLMDQLAAARSFGTGRS